MTNHVSMFDWQDDGPTCRTASEELFFRGINSATVNTLAGVPVLEMCQRLASGTATAEEVLAMVRGGAGTGGVGKWWGKIGGLFDSLEDARDSYAKVRPDVSRSPEYAAETGEVDGRGVIIGVAIIGKVPMSPTRPGELWDPDLDNEDARSSTGFGHNKNYVPDGTTIEVVEVHWRSAYDMNRWHVLPARGLSVTASSDLEEHYRDRPWMIERNYVQPPEWERDKDPYLFENPWMRDEMVYPEPYGLPDWTTPSYAPYGPLTLYRGLRRVPVGKDPSLWRDIMEGNLRAAADKALSVMGDSGYGVHWSTDIDKAHEYAEYAMDRMDLDEVSVVITADWAGGDHDVDWGDQRDRGQWAHASEVRLFPGDSLTITGLKVWYPMESRWVELPVGGHRITSTREAFQWSDSPWSDHDFVNPSYAPYGPMTLYRGMSIQHHDDEEVAELRDAIDSGDLSQVGSLAVEILSNMSEVGVYWSTDLDVAYRFAEETSAQHGGSLSVVMTVEWDGGDHDVDFDEPDRDGFWGFESEVRLLSGEQLKLTGLLVSALGSPYVRLDERHLGAWGNNYVEASFRSDTKREAFQWSDSPWSDHQFNESGPPGQYQNHPTYAPYGPMILFRGIRDMFSSHEDYMEAREAVENRDERTLFEIFKREAGAKYGPGQVGKHWSTDLDWAEEYTRSWGEEYSIIMHAVWDGGDHVPTRSIDWGVESEIELIPMDRVEIIRLTFDVSTPRGYISHTFEPPPTFMKASRETTAAEPGGVLPYPESDESYDWESVPGTDRLKATTNDGEVWLYLWLNPYGQAEWQAWDDHGHLEDGKFSISDIEAAKKRANRILSEYDSDPLMTPKRFEYYHEYEEIRDRDDGLTYW